METKNHSLLLVANWDSNTEYAWWLMEGFWLLLGKHYSELGKDAYLVYPSISKISKKISASSIIVEQLDFRRKDLLSLLAQCRFIYRHRVSIIYFSDYPSCNIRYFFYRLAGVKHIVVHDHVPGIKDQPGKVKLLLKKWLHRMSPICANGLIAATEYVRSRHIEINGMPEDKCFCAPNGLPKRPVMPRLNLHKEFDIAENRKIMVTTGRANKYKGIDFALTVLAQLVNKHHRRDIHYLFCGDGPDLELLKSVARNLGIQSYVTFTGQVDSVFSYLGSCDIAIHPSQGEVGYSLSILEYMQAGLPVVVPDNPSVCGATVDGLSGFLYKENDLLDATDKLALLLNKPSMIEDMGAHAKQEVLEKYRLSDTHEQLWNAVSTIVAP